MNTRRLQGLALILSAVCLLLGLVLPNGTVLDVVTVIGIILFMLGIPAVNSAQPMGWAGLLGIVLLELAALIALGFRLGILSSGLGETLGLTSAVLGMLGAVIIGWLTTRAQVFPAWVGWLFLAQGVLNFLSGLLNLGGLASILAILITLLDAAALLGYGYFIYRKS